VYSRLSWAAALALFLFAANAGGALASKKAAATPAPSASDSASPTPSPEPPTSAIPRLEAHLKIQPDDHDAMAQLAGYYLQVAHPELTLPLTQKLIGAGIKTAQVYFLDGSAELELGQVAPAVASLEHASDLEPTSSQILFTLTEVYLRTNRLADADRVAKRATAFNATNEQAFSNYGLVLTQEKKFDDARTQFEAGAKLNPTDAAPIVLEARTYEAQNAPALALQTYNRALTVDPKSLDALIGKAHVQAAQNSIPDAIATYEQAIPVADTDEERVAILDQEAGIYLNQKDTVDAEAVLKRSISTYPNVFVAHLAYGDFYAAESKYQNAESEWKLALGPNNDSHDALLRLGDYYFQTNQMSRAVDEYKRASDLDPNDPQLLAQLGQAYGMDRQFSRSRDSYQRSFVLARTPQALAGIGASDFQLHSYHEGAAAFDALQNGAPDFLRANPQLFYVMGKVYTGDNQKGKARSAYQHFLAFVKPGSAVQIQVKKLLGDLGTKTPSPKPGAAH
jgi:tetratricopeptide (TPR) repeat protein